MADKQDLHIVLGGELEELTSVHFRDLSKLDVVGVFPSYEAAVTAWKPKAQGTVDNAHMRYFVFNLQKLIDHDGE